MPSEPLRTADVELGRGTVRFSASDPELGDFEAMLDRYYHLRGWGADGVPRPETLRRLALEGRVKGLP